jgi:hypothetical protein
MGAGAASSSRSIRLSLLVAAPEALARCGFVSGRESCRDKSDSLRAGILNLLSGFWPGSMAAMLRICFTCSAGVGASLHHRSVFALTISKVIVSVHTFLH